MSRKTGTSRRVREAEAPPDRPISSQVGATIVGAGRADPELVRKALRRGPLLVCADGGARHAAKLGLVPDRVIGDMDSLPTRLLKGLDVERVISVQEQESTDFEKCVRVTLAPLLLGVGVLEPRIDHGLASLNVLVRRHDRRIILIGESDLVFHCPPEIQLKLPIGTRVSLFPMREVRGTSRGLLYPIDGLKLEPAGRTGTSNENCNREVGLRFRMPGMLVILPIRCFDEACEALLASRNW